MNKPLPFQRILNICLALVALACLPLLARADLACLAKVECVSLEEKPVSAGNPVEEGAINKTFTKSWKTQYRGMNASPHRLTETDIKDFADMGGNLLRLSFAATPLMKIKEPNTIDNAVFEKLDKILNLCEKYNVQVLLDPHYYPGMNHSPWTMYGSDQFFSDFKYHDLLVQLWESIAQRYKDRGDVIAGYDLLNEPSQNLPLKPGSPSDLNLLYAKLIQAIRKYDTHHTLVIAAPYFYEDSVSHGYCEGTRYLNPALLDSNTVVEVHFYEPARFTHQSISKEEVPVSYPGTITEYAWAGGRTDTYDALRLKQSLELARQFSVKNKVEILVGEFSAPRHLGNYGANLWIEDVIKIMEEFRFSWAYHEYRGFQGWDAERSNTDKADLKRYASTPRLLLLKKYFALNEHPEIKKMPDEKPRAEANESKN